MNEGDAAQIGAIMVSLEIISALPVHMASRN
jgi:hypothetical protein